MPAEKPEDSVPEIEIEIDPVGETATPAEPAPATDDLPPPPKDDDLPPIPDDDELLPPPPEDDELPPIPSIPSDPTDDDDDPIIVIPTADGDPIGGNEPPPPGPVPKLTLVSESGQRLSMNVTTDLGKNNCKALGDEAHFLDEKQVTLEKTDDGWQVIPNEGTPNETFLNDQAITEPQPLEKGDVIAVGRESKGVIKMRMTVQLD